MKNTSRDLWKVNCTS